MWHLFTLRNSLNNIVEEYTQDCIDEMSYEPPNQSQDVAHLFFREKNTEVLEEPTPPPSSTPKPVQKKFKAFNKED